MLFEVELLYDFFGGAWFVFDLEVGADLFYLGTVFYGELGEADFGFGAGVIMGVGLEGGKF